MKTCLFILGFLFILTDAGAQTIVSQGKLDAAPKGNGPTVVYLQGSAIPVSEESQPATKQVVVLGEEPQTQAVVMLTGTAQPWEPNAVSAEKQIIELGAEPVKVVIIQGSATLLEDKKD